MKQSEANAFVQECFHGEPAPCTCACPFHLDLRSFLRKIIKKRWDSAYKELQSALIFPRIGCAICGGACEAQCRSTRGDNASLAVREIERVCLAQAKKAPMRYTLPQKETKVAVIGAGVAGLSCALLLAQQRYQVTIFERNTKPGGSLHMSFDKDALSSFIEEISMQFSTVEATIKYECEIIELDTLRKQFDAIYVATGNGGNDFGLLADWDAQSLSVGLPGVFWGGELCRMNKADAMASGARAAKILEAYLQTGNTEFATQGNEGKYIVHDLPKIAEEYKSPIAPVGAEYTLEEASEEAARCLQCDCSNCITHCELLAKYNKTPARIAIDVYMDSQARRNSITTCGVTRETFSCNMCGRCAQKCPKGCDIGKLFQFSREDRVERAFYPPALHDYWMRNMALANDELGYVSAQPCKYAFFPGCQLGADSPERVLSTLRCLRENFDKETGVILGCCGAPAYWAGQRNRLDEVLALFHARWIALGRPTLLLACANCSKTLQMFLPEIPCISVYQALSELDISFAANTAYPEAAVFDPCAAFGFMKWKDSVRALASRASLVLSDFDSDGQCCGNGGHMMLADHALYDQITQARAQASKLPYLVYCANCRAVFASKGKPCAHILDVIFALHCEENPSLYRKKQNMIEVRKRVAEMFGEEFSSTDSPWAALDVIIGQSVRVKMEENLVDDQDVLETIWYSEQTGEGFEDEQGRILCCIVRSALTYWILYSKQEERFIVEDVYCHRMRFREDG